MIILTATEATTVRGISPTRSYSALEPVLLKTGEYMLPEAIEADPANVDIAAYLALLPRRTVAAGDKYGAGEYPVVPSWKTAGKRLAPVSGPPLVTFGFATDVHRADKNTAQPDGIINAVMPFRDADQKMAVAVAAWNAAALDFVMFGGDFIDDSGSAALVLADMPIIENAYAQVSVPRYYLFGNHELDRLTKQQFIDNTGMDAANYYFDLKGVRFIALDACYRSDNDTDHYAAGNYLYTNTYVPPTERSWLAATLASAPGKVVVFCHQRLDGASNFCALNAATVRTILEVSGKVIAVLSGHQHINEKVMVNGIPYFEMEAMLDGLFPINAYAIVSVYADQVRIAGYGNQVSY